MGKYGRSLSVRYVVRDLPSISLKGEAGARNCESVISSTVKVIPRLFPSRGISVFPSSVVVGSQKDKLFRVNDGLPFWMLNFW